MMIRTVILLLTVLMLTSQYVRAEEDHAEPVDFTLSQLHGDQVSVSGFRGKWVVLNYWATWCGPCRKEIPDLSVLHESRDDIVVLGLAFEDTEIEYFDEFLEEFHPTYPILLVDVYEPPEPFGAPRALPTTIVLNTEGYPVKTYLGR
jgi:thiol-disulfide isomerase/thioredoxin